MRIILLIKFVVGTLPDQYRGFHCWDTFPAITKGDYFFSRTHANFVSPVTSICYNYIPSVHDNGLHYATVLHSTALHSTALLFTTLHYFMLYSSMLHSMLHTSTLHASMLHSSTLHSTTLQPLCCTPLQCTPQCENLMFLTQKLTEVSNWYYKRIGHCDVEGGLVYGQSGGWMGTWRLFCGPNGEVL